MPTLAAQKFAAVPMPELDPPVPAAGRPSPVACARVATRVVGVEAVAAQRAVVAGHAGGGEVGQFGEDGLGEDHRAGLAQVRGERRVVGRDEALEGHRPAGGWQVGRVDVVLERDRDAVQRPAHLPGLALGVEPIGLGQRPGVHRQRRVDALFVERDALQVLLDQLSGRDPPLGHRLLHVGDAGFDHGEGRRRRGGWGRATGGRRGNHAGGAEQTERHQGTSRRRSADGAAGCSGRVNRDDRARPA